MRKLHAFAQKEDFKLKSERELWWYKFHNLTGRRRQLELAQSARVAKIQTISDRITTLERELSLLRSGYEIASGELGQVIRDLENLGDSSDESVCD